MTTRLLILSPRPAQALAEAKDGSRQPLERYDMSPARGVQVLRTVTTSRDNWTQIIKLQSLFLQDIRSNRGMRLFGAEWMLRHEAARLPPFGPNACLLPAGFCASNYMAVDLYHCAPPIIHTLCDGCGHYAEVTNSFSLQPQYHLHRSGGSGASGWLRHITLHEWSSSFCSLHPSFFPGDRVVFAIARMATMPLSLALSIAAVCATLPSASATDANASPFQIAFNTTESIGPDGRLPSNKISARKDDR
jgi:hypothetical protein